eukprot:TRINITY_DN7556_c0_g1_i2.p1 TRINITY_DN7556_c0_g1~~TRINITY_DN7556_c0_g1_i2.p1  ORF type:complete len:523 (-),score=126.04 TRINITY_DN7556_c0_g1_i2:377-1945(-)
MSHAAASPRCSMTPGGCLGQHGLARRRQALWPQKPLVYRQPGSERLVDHEVLPSLKVGSRNCRQSSHLGRAQTLRRAARSRRGAPDRALADAVRQQPTAAALASFYLERRAGKRAAGGESADLPDGIEVLCFRRLAQLVQKQPHVNVAKKKGAAHEAAASQAVEREAVGKLTKRMEGVLNRRGAKLGARDLSSMMLAAAHLLAWCAGRLEALRPKLRLLLLNASRTFLDASSTASPQDFAHAAWALARLGRQAEDGDCNTDVADTQEELRTHLRSLSGDALPKLRCFKIRDLVELTWAHAALSAHHHATFLAEVFSEVRGQLLGDPPQKLVPQDISNFGWAVAKMAADETSRRLPAAEGMLRLLIDRSIGRLEAFRPQELTNFVWAAAAVAVEDEGFSQAAASAALPRLQLFKPQELSSLAWSFGSVGLRSPKLFQALVTNALQQRLGAFELQGVANIAWAYATLLEAHTPYGRRFLREVASDLGDDESRIANASAQAISNLAWAYAASEVEEAVVSALCSA